MSMSLTSADIQAIKEVFDVRLNNFEENLMIRIEARVQQAELERNDHQDEAIKKIRKALHAA